MTSLDRAYRRLANRALARGRTVTDQVLGIAAVPDVAIAEAAANGLTAPPTCHLVRDDGRTVAFYRLPDTKGAAA